MPKYRMPWESISSQQPAAGYRMPWEPIPSQRPVPEMPNLLKEGAKWFVGQSGEALDKQMALQALEGIAPELRRHYEYEAEHGKGRSASEIYQTLRGFHDPGYSGEGNKALGLGLFAAQFPVAGALGAVVPGLGHAAGWGAVRHMAHLADPGLAGASLAWDVGGAVGAKALGTAGSMLYRSKIMPKLAEKGLTSKELHPVASRVLDWAEGAMDPLVGPKARNFGMPRWLNRKLQKVGPRGAAPKVPTARLPAGQQELDLPGQRTFPGMRPRGVGKLPKPVSRIQVGDQLKYKAEIEPVRPAWAKAATTGKRQTDLFRTALEELPPEPEQLTTLTQVGQASQPPLGLPGAAAQGRFPFLEPELSTAKWRQQAPSLASRRTGAPGAPGTQPGLGLQQPPYQAGIPGIAGPELLTQPRPAAVMGPRPTRAVTPKVAQEAPEAVSRAITAKIAEDIATTVPRGKTLTWKGYTKGLQQATGLPRREMLGVLRVHKALASSYGETPDELVGRMFRGVMTEAEHKATFPGKVKFWGRRAGGTPLGAAHFMEDGRAVLAFSNKLGKVGSIKQLEVALHEPLHVFYRWMPAREKAVLSKALKTKSDVWTTAQEEQAVRWGLEYLRSGRAPTKALAKTFERFKTWLTSLITRGRKGRAPKEVEEVLARMLTPGGYKGQVEGSTISKALRAGKG